MPYLLLILLLGGCSSTQIIDTWSAEQNEPPAKRILLIGLIKDPVTRRFFEQHFIEQSKKMGIQLLPSYELAPTATDLDEKEEVVHLVKQVHADGVLIGLLKGVRKEYGHVPSRLDWHPEGYFFDPFYDYFYQTYRAVYRSGYIGSDNFLLVQMHYYSARSQKKLWAAQIETKNPHSLVETIYHIADVTLSALKRKHIL